MGSELMDMGPQPMMNTEEMKAEYVSIKLESHFYLTLLLLLLSTLKENKCTCLFDDVGCLIG